MDMRPTRIISVTHQQTQAFVNPGRMIIYLKLAARYVTFIAPGFQVGLLVIRDIAPDPRQVAQAHRQLAGRAAAGRIERVFRRRVEAEKVLLSDGEVDAADGAVASGDKADLVLAVDVTAVDSVHLDGKGDVFVDVRLRRPEGLEATVN